MQQKLEMSTLHNPPSVEHVYG